MSDQTYLVLGLAAIVLIGFVVWWGGWIKIGRGEDGKIEVSAGGPAQRGRLSVGSGTKVNSGGSVEMGAGEASGAGTTTVGENAEIVAKGNVKLSGGMQTGAARDKG